MVTTILLLLLAIGVLWLTKRRKKEVPQGLQVFDENGNAVIDLTTNLTCVLGVKTYSKNGINNFVSAHGRNSGLIYDTITVSVPNGYKLWAYCICPQFDYFLGEQTIVAQTSNNQINVYVKRDGDGNSTVVWGIY
ncbi:hypothetical protein [Veillonella sp.]|uniref:hypothetical protein n=1 Tax=Veillonella sp. TaxID=1926307 RepID=UPI00399443FD